METQVFSAGFGGPEWLRQQGLKAHTACICGVEGAAPQAQQGKTEEAQKGGYDLTSPHGRWKLPGRRLGRYFHTESTILALCKNEIGLKQSTGVGPVNGFKKKKGGGHLWQGTYHRQKSRSLQEHPLHSGPPMCFTLKTAVAALTGTLHSNERRAHGSFSLNAVSPRPSLASVEWESHKGWD